MAAAEPPLSGFEVRVSGFGFWVSGFRFQVSNCGFRVSGFGFRVSSSGFRVSGGGLRAGLVGAVEVLVDRLQPPHVVVPALNVKTTTLQNCAAVPRRARIESS